MADHGNKASVTADASNYDVLRRRLEAQATTLLERTEQLNEARKRTFGGSELAILANERVRTENNCVPRDLVAFRGILIMGYKVFLGLRQDTHVQDVLSLHRFDFKSDGSWDLSEIPRETIPGFLDDPRFLKEFADLFRYYKETKLLQVRVEQERILVIFQTGATLGDQRVFRWSVDASGHVAFLDGRGERDHVYPQAHDFEWIRTTRDEQRNGRFPHVSIRDIVFVETTGGDLTLKVEDNTETGQGIYAEPVDDPNQALDDAEIHYAFVGNLILLKILPYREDAYRYLVFNRQTKQVSRIDAMGESCRQLPEDHGIVFPGGYYLETGEAKIFDEHCQGLELFRVQRSPNGEDVLYTYHRRDQGLYALTSYNLIRKECATPILCHGVSCFSDGTMVLFRSASEEPSRVHPVQIWRTPFTTAEFAAKAQTDGSFLSKVGNADLVRGISDAYSIARAAKRIELSRSAYEDLAKRCDRVIDSYYWIGHEEALQLGNTIAEIRKSSELVLGELEKVVAMQQRAIALQKEAENAYRELHTKIRPEDMRSVDDFMGALSSLRAQRGHLVSLREVRYIDLAAIDALEEETNALENRVSTSCVAFLGRDDAFVPISQRLDEIASATEHVERTTGAKALGEELERASEGLSILSEVVAGLHIDDAVERARILEAIGEVFAKQNRVRALIENRRKELAATESRADFGAQLKLFGQSVAASLAAATTPDRADTELARLLVSIEEIEARFGELDEFVLELAKRREEITDALGARKQQLLEERQRRVQGLFVAAERILAGVGRRSRSFKSEDELNGYFAADPMIAKLRQLAEQLRKESDSVRADELEGRIKSARQDALRVLRDRLDLYEDGERIVRLGAHRFSVHDQPFELTIVPREDAERASLCLHLTGTDFIEVIDDPELEATRQYWSRTLASETDSVYRSEYLASSILFDAEAGKNGVSLQWLGEKSHDETTLGELVRNYAQPRYDEGYERGVHDVDATRILAQVLTLRASAGLLRFPPRSRAIACAYFGFGIEARAKETLSRRAMSLGRLRSSTLDSQGQSTLAAELGPQLLAFAHEVGIECDPREAQSAARYLVEELSVSHPRFVTSAAAFTLRDELLAHLDRNHTRRAFEDDLRALDAHPKARLDLAFAWVKAVARQYPELEHAALETSILLLTERLIDREASHALVTAEVKELLGSHPRIQHRTLVIRLDEFLGRLQDFHAHDVPGFRSYRELRHRILERERKRLRIEELRPKPMSTFVRNQLIDQVYLPMIGDNLSKQIGAAGEHKRTDNMGLLLLISPPGYGKTTLMEYVANRLGLVFVKINGPSIGHAVTSLDPALVKSATAQKEVEKINFALEMGNNVMLYLDDIQHTNPELLQQFISMCDAQRRMEGIWRGKSRTYDLRGKKFCVVMAGNPYTETGEKFRIPDMLANRADTYNLGEVLSGRAEAFALSYIENALTSNPALAPLTTRPPNDIAAILKIAAGENVGAGELSHGYSAAELSEITTVLKCLFRVRDVLLKVNAEYIRSASQEDAYRTEPPFKLQGSYRNMSKMAAKVVAAMNDDELEQLIDDHYRGEAQTLTTGAEQNLLKLAELRGRLGGAELARWQEIQKEYRRRKTMGGADDDPVTRMTGTLSTLGDGLEQIKLALEAVNRPEITVTVDAPEGYTEFLAQQIRITEQTLLPLVQGAARNLEDSRSLQQHMVQLLELLQRIDVGMRSS